MLMTFILLYTPLMLSFFFNSKSFILFLITLEMILLNCYFIVSLLFSNNNFFFILYLMIFIVMESCLGISLLVLKIYHNSQELLKTKFLS